MKQLLEDYKRRLNTLNEELDRTIDEADDLSKIYHLTIKRGCYRTFIAELEQLLPYNTSVEKPEEKIETRSYNEIMEEFLNKEPELEDLSFLDEPEDKTPEM